MHSFGTSWRRGRNLMPPCRRWTKARLVASFIAALALSPSWDIGPFRRISGVFLTLLNAMESARTALTSIGFWPISRVAPTILPDMRDSPRHDAEARMHPLAYMHARSTLARPCGRLTLICHRRSVQKHSSRILWRGLRCFSVQRTRRQAVVQWAVFGIAAILPGLRESIGPDVAPVPPRLARRALAIPRSVPAAQRPTPGFADATSRRRCSRTRPGGGSSGR